MELTTESDLSFFYRLLSLVIRPLRPRLTVSNGKPTILGSPALDPPKTRCIIHHRLVEGIHLYDLESPRPTFTLSPICKQRIYYFAGGGFKSPPSRVHWKFCVELYLQVCDLYNFTIVSYPLAPNNPAPESLSALQNWLGVASAEAELTGEGITLMGDSSGGNIALSLAFWCAQAKAANEAVHQSRRPLVKNVLVISPATDLRNVNPDITEANRHDPVLTIGLIEDVAKGWVGTWSRDRPEVSPNLADFTALRVSQIRIHGVIGTHDVLAPDAIAFRGLCAENNISGEWLQWEGQMHCFPLASMYGMPEGKKGLKWIADVLRRNS